MKKKTLNFGVYTGSPRNPIYFNRLSLSYYFYYLFCQWELSNLEIRYKILAEGMKEIFLEHKGRYGSRRIKVILQKEYQLTITRRRITKFLHA